MFYSGSVLEIKGSKMAKPTVTGLILQKLENLEKKIDDMSVVALPKVITDVAVMKAEAVTEAKTTSRFHGTAWGLVTLFISLIGIAISYLKH